MYAEYLEYDGYQVEQARNGVEALPLAALSCPRSSSWILRLPWLGSRGVGATEADAKGLP
jgi:hypothetical protein